MDADSEPAHSSSTIATPQEHGSNTLPATEQDMEKTASEDKKITLAEDAALTHARTFTKDRTPLHISFGPDDKDNPRNFSRARKWYM